MRRSVEKTWRKILVQARSIAAFLAMNTLLFACGNQSQIDGVLGTSTAINLLPAAIQSSPILLLPSSDTLSPGSQILFTATGGKPPYVFSLLIGGGSLNPVSGLYTASVAPGTAVVKATDSVGSIALASLTISSVSAGAPVGPLVISPLTKTLAINNTFTFTASGGQPPYTFSLYSGVGGIHSLSGAYSASSTGSSIVRVTDGLGSTADASLIINSALSLSSSSPTVSVNNTASLLATGGVPPYVYSLVSGSGSVSGSTYTSSSISGAGSARVTDSIGNSADTLITVNSALSLNPNSKSLAVNNFFSFSTSGGVIPFTYAVLAGGSGGSINSSSGTYVAPAISGSDTVRVTDSLGNTASASVAINGALAISPASATLGLNGSLTFSAIGGVSPFTYTLVSGAGNISAFSGTYSATSTGSATIRVTDAQGNTSSAAITINPSLSLTATRTTLSINNSTALTGSGGVPPYVYSLVSGTGSVTGSTYTAPSSAGAGNVRVTDSANNTADVLISVNPVLSISPSTKTLAVGNTVSFTAAGGVSPYTFSMITGGAGGSINASSGFYIAPGSGGSDSVRVTDALGNTITATIAINGAISLSPSTLSLGLNNSSTFSGSGGVSPYNFSIASGVGSINSGSGVFSASSAGSSVVRITDSLGNTATANVTVGGGLALAVSRSVVAVTNTSALTASGGVTPYTYSLIAGSGSISGTTYTAPGTAGTATIRVTDNLGNVNDVNITINSALTVSPTSRSLTTANTYTFNASGGVSPYTYSIASGAGSIGSSSGVFSAASPGTSTILVTDSLGNTTNATAIVTATLTIAPTTRTITITNTAALSASGGVSPYTYSIVAGGVGSINATTGIYTAPASAGSATVQVTDSIGNTSNAAVTVNAALAMTPSACTLAVNNTTAFTGLGGVPPYTFTVFSGGGSINSSGLFTAPATAGTTIVKVTDAATSSVTSTITINAALNVSPTATTIAVNNTAILTASGGVSPYAWTTNFGTVSSSGTFTAPASTGTATVTLSDAVGNTRTATITVAAALTISPSSTTLAASGLTRTFTASGGSGTYTYSTTIGTIGSASGILNPPASSGTGTVTVTDGLGNTSQSAITVNAALTLSPGTKILAVTNSFTLTAAGGIAPLVYSIYSGTGSLASNVYTAPGTAGSAVVRVTDAMGNFAASTITINAALSISPTSKSLAVNNSQTFIPSAGVGPYTYFSTNGAITTAGAYTAPASEGTSTITVTDALGNTASAAVTISAALIISPANKTILINDVLQFSATGGAGSNSYSVVAGTGTVVSATGVYSAPSTAGTATVRVTDSSGNLSNATVTISTFTTIENYQYTSSYHSALNSMTKDNAGNLYAAGYGNDASGISHWLVKKSTDAGATWSVLDNYNYASNQNSVANFVVTDSTGAKIYVGGSASNSSGYTRWVVRASTDSGATWSVIDDYAYTANYTAAAKAALIRANGDLIITGYGNDASSHVILVTRKYSGGLATTIDAYLANSYTWTCFGAAILQDLVGNLFVGGLSGGNGYYIRKSLDGGATWSQSYYWVYGVNNGSTGAYALAMDSTGAIYSGGLSSNASTMTSLRSTDSGANWGALDYYRYSNSGGLSSTGIFGLAVDANNNIWEAGSFGDASALPHWTVRKINLTLGGTTVEDFQLSSSQRANANTIVILNSGRVVVGGAALDAGGISHWVVRSF